MKTKQFLLILLAFLLPLSSFADVWQDPETKVNYEYTVGNSEASVKASDYNYYNSAGSPNVSGNINILSYFTIDGNEYTVTSIGSGAFNYCSSLTSVTIPNSVTSIGDYAFSGCSGLTSVTIPNSVTSIGSYAFYKCSGLTSVTIPNSVTSIGSSAFEYCSGLTSVTIPNSVTSIGGSAFYGCSGLTSIVVESGNTVYDSRNNCYAIIRTANNSLIVGCKNTKIPNSVTSIGESAFRDCSGLTSVTIPNSVTSIGNYAFEYCSGLTSITIPNSVTSIGDFAFFDCSGLTSVTIPNSVTSIGDYAFSGCSGLTSVISLIMEPFAIDNDVFSVYNTATLYVPIGTIDAYKATNGWKNFKNIEEIIDGGSTLTITVIDENGANLTNNVSIVWYDADGKQIGTGKSLNGIEDGTELFYSVMLNEDLGRVYREVKMQKVVANGEPITCQLKKIGRVTLEGRVSATDIDKTTATVSVKQMLNGKYPQNYTTQTDEQGVFSIEVYDDETDITISGDGYLNATIHRDGFSGNGNVGTIPVSLISGFAIAANITMQEVVSDASERYITSWTDGLNNIDFSLTNKTKGTAITDFTVQNGNIIIKTGVSVGDEISLTAKSKQGIFADATTTFTIEEGANAFNLQLTELGGVDATCAASANGSTSGYLYDSNGVLAAKGSYVGETLSLRHLQSGNYTLVSMGNSMLLGSMTRLSDLTATGLKEGTDYVTSNVTVADGELAMVSVSEVPRLDESQFYYTNSDTYFSANKASVTAGNYLTLQAHVDFKPEYADKADGVTLTIDLPEGCEMVENSVIANHQAVPHSVNGNRVTMTLNKEQYGGQVRFCIIPTLNQSYNVTAMASFDIDGQVTQPIGIAQFEAKGLSLSVVEQTANTNITINGTAKGHSEVSIYDNDVLIGKTSSKADGSWTAECELYKPYSHSFHDIYAMIVTENGMELTSETKQVEYDKNMLVPEKVTMLYYNPEVDTNYNIVFDLINGTTAPSSYYYFPYKNWPNWWQTRETEPKDFTFLADFTHNDSTVIKNVNIKVLNSDGTVRTLPATFDGKQNKWVATTKYSSSSRLPRNVAVEYDLIAGNIIEIDSARIADDNNQFLNMLKNYVENIDTTKFEILEVRDNFISYNYQTYTMDEPVVLNIEKLDYDKFISEMEASDYFSVEHDGITTHVRDSILVNQHITWFWTETNKIMYKLEIIKNEDTSANVRSQKKMPQGFWNVFDAINNNMVGNAVLNLLCGAGDIRKIILEYQEGVAEYNNWLTQLYLTHLSYVNMYNETKQLLDARCPDGSLRLDNSVYAQANSKLAYCFNEANNMKKQFQSNLQRVERDLSRKRNASSMISAAGCAGSAALGVATLGGKAVMTLVSSIATNIDISFGANGYSHLIRNEFYTSNDLSAWYTPANMEIINNYSNLQSFITSSYKSCKVEEEEEEEEKKDKPIDEKSDNKDDFKGNGTHEIIDPSGYVYEAVLSNRLEGVTATCYQKVQVEDMYGDMTEEAVVWNAADYSQQNPQLTDATGFYRWDVPQGMWQVKYEKDGYETAYSEWLPVPPPQLDVNIGMKQSTPPTIKQMHGYESGITIDMSKYMLPATMTAQNITVTHKGAAVNGSIEMLNAEKAPLSGETYVQKVKFVPKNRFHVGDEVVVTIKKDVKSYCNVNMIQNHVQTVKIESEITAIEVAEEVAVPYRSAYDLHVKVLPETAAAGKKLHVSTSSAMIASLNVREVTIDESGWAVIRVNGELPGGAVLTLSIDGYDLTAMTKVKVKTFRKGDVNHDIIIDVADIAQIIDLMAGCDCIPSDEADVNNDGVVDVADIAAVITIMAGTDEKPTPQDTVEAVDLGLPSGTKWANMNLGAKKPEEYGEYYAWGETSTKDKYDWENYKWGSKNDALTKYCPISDYAKNGIISNLTNLESVDDAAYANSGGRWRMPTKEEILELVTKTNVKRTKVNGVEGFMFINKVNESKYIFLPAAGCYKGRTKSGVNNKGFYWSSSVFPEDLFWTWGPDNAYMLDFNCSENTVEFEIEAGFDPPSIDERCYGFTIRPVQR